MYLSHTRTHINVYTHTHTYIYIYLRFKMQAPSYSHTASGFTPASLVSSAKAVCGVTLSECLKSYWMRLWNKRASSGRRRVLACACISCSQQATGDVAPPISSIQTPLKNAIKCTPAPSTQRRRDGYCYQLFTRDVAQWSNATQPYLYGGREGTVLWWLQLS